MRVMVDFIREMALKKSFKYGKYGSFEHWLFLFCFVFCGGLFVCLFVLGALFEL